MPKISKKTAKMAEHGPVTDCHGTLGGYTVNFVTFHQTIDHAPLLKGLPGDQCSCPHWGYVLKGKLSYRVGDHEEVVEAGDAFYLPPGHVPVAEAGCEIVQFSPTAELCAVEAVLMKNVKAMMAD